MERKISSPSLFLRFHSANLFFFQKSICLEIKESFYLRMFKFWFSLAKFASNFFKKLLVKNALRLHCEVFHSVRNKIFWTKSWKFLEFFMFLLFFFFSQLFCYIWLDFSINSDPSNIIFQWTLGISIWVLNWNVTDEKSTT